MNDCGYWFGNGFLQRQLDEMNKSGFSFTKREKSVFRQYYRYYNDGDAPIGSKFCAEDQVRNFVEQQANIAIAKAYLRFVKQTVDIRVRFYARKKLQGFTAWRKSRNE